MGYNCGYVGIKYGHPLYKKSYHSKLKGLKSFVERTENGHIGKRGIIPVFCNVGGITPTMDIIFDVHGSVTFTNGGKNSTYPVNSNLWWIGFDCAHSGDNPQKCNLEFCEAECESLAKQIKEVIIVATRKTLK